MVDVVTAPAGNALIEELSQLRTARARTRFLRAHRELLQPTVVEELYTGVVRLALFFCFRIESFAPGECRFCFTMRCDY